MTDRPSDRAVAQAFREWCAESSRWCANNPPREWVTKRARDIDANPFTVYNHRECPSCGCKSLFTEPPAHRDGCREVPTIDAAAPEGAQAVACLYVGCRECNSCGHAGLNDASDTLGACHDCEWSGPDPVEDRCPGCRRTDCMGAACPKCGGLYRLVADATLTAQPTAHPQDAEDAARYRWLRDRALYFDRQEDGDSREGTPYCVYGLDMGDATPTFGKELDAFVDDCMAIDAARAGDGGERG